MKIKNDKIVIQIICVLAAIGLWILVMIEKNPMQDKTFSRIPVTLNNAVSLVKEGNQYIMMDDIDGFTVNVTIRGLSDAVSKLQAKDIKATAKITEFQEGANSVLVEIEAPKDMEIKTVSPRYITCHIDQLVSVPVNVMVQYQGSQASGYYLEMYGASNPDSVIVKGPRSIVNSVSSAVAVVDIEDKQESVIQNKPVVLYDNTDKEIDNQYLTISPSSVQASYDIFPIKTIAVKPVITGEPAEGYKLTDYTADMTTVQIAAPKEILDTIFFVETEPLDITDATFNMLSEKKLVVGKDVKIVGDRNKANVNATIEKVVEKVFEFSFENLEFANRGEDYVITPVDEEQVIKVSVKATASEINKINSSDVILKVDLINTVEGINELALSVSLKENDNYEELTCDTEIVRLNIEQPVYQE